MRERLKDLDIRITELSEYLHISRPTLYKFIEKYDEGKTRGIDSRVMDLFRYIDSNPDIGKKNVISFILDNLETNKKNSSLIKSIIEYENSDRATVLKNQIIITLAKSENIDELIPCIYGYMSELNGREANLSDFKNYIAKYIKSNNNR